MDAVDLNDAAAQYLAGNQATIDSEYHKLWLIVLLDAIARGPREFAEAVWLLCLNRRSTGSFYWVCDTVGIDGDYLREQLRKEWRPMLIRRHGRSVAKLLG